MFVRGALSTLALFVAQKCAYAQVPLKTVDLGYATYQTDASTDIGVTSFLGIRYAAPPTGDLRFRAPQPPANVTGIQNATAQADWCWQTVYGAGAGDLDKRTEDVESEDCLFLSVHVPTELDLEANASLPVVVWLHGGGYALGSNAYSTPSYSNAQALVRNSNYSLITVQMQYRLGPFGFLAGAAVGADGALNAGLLDQQFALQWVQEHIAKFGGDPARVTLHGESAGAGAALQHLVANGGRTRPPLFRAAMLESPFLPSQYAYDDAIPEAVYANLSSLVGCDGSLDCLRKVDAAVLSQRGQELAAAAFFGTFTFVPVVDGAFIAERPSEALRKGLINPVNATLVTTNAHEGTIFVDADALARANATLAKYVANVFPRLNGTAASEAAALYAAAAELGGAGVPELATYVLGEAFFVCPALQLVDALGNSSWKGEFAVSPALHGDELYYLWANSVTGWPAFNNSAFIASFQSAFVGTATALDPSSDLLPDWPAWGAGGQSMLFNETAAGEAEVGVVPRDEALAERCAFWHSLGDVIAQ